MQASSQESNLDFAGRGLLSKTKKDHVVKKRDVVHYWFPCGESFGESCSRRETAPTILCSQFYLAEQGANTDQYQITDGNGNSNVDDTNGQVN